MIDFKQSSFSRDRHHGVWVMIAPPTLEREGAVFLQNSNGPGPAHRYTFSEWEEFIRGVKAGEFDLPSSLSSLP